MIDENKAKIFLTELKKVPTISSSQPKKRKTTTKKETLEEKNVDENDIQNIEEEDFNYLVELFGEGFKKSEYKQMYRRYKELENNYPVGRSAMHQEALVTYVKYAYKRDKAISEDDIEAADKWGKLASKQATDAKINPSQLSAADLSDGITNFSKIAEAVEREQDIIPLLPTYNQPNDKIDYAIWQMILYIRRLQNLPEVTYSELYKFLMEKYEENKKKLPFHLQKFVDGHYDEAD